MGIYSYMWTYITIYIYIYICLSGRLSSFLTSGSVIVALYLPMLELSAPTPPIVDYLFGTSLMKMFLWTVGSFYVFGEQWDLTCFLPLRFHMCKKTQISTFIVYLQRSIIPKLGKALISLRFPFGKGSYFVEIPICRSVGWLMLARLGGFLAFAATDC